MYDVQHVDPVSLAPLLGRTGTPGTPGTGPSLASAGVVAHVDTLRTKARYVNPSHADCAALADLMKARLCEARGECVCALGAALIDGCESGLDEHALAASAANLTIVAASINAVVTHVRTFDGDAGLVSEYLVRPGPFRLDQILLIWLDLAYHTDSCTLSHTR